jgi:DNA-directed RNA polymerase sigma subunit (sigma70/sigma32)
VPTVTANKHAYKEQQTMYRTQAEVAAMLKVSTRNVAQIERNAIRKLWRMGVKNANRRRQQAL